MSRLCPYKEKNDGLFRVLHELAKPICSSPSKIAIVSGLFVALCTCEAEQS